jgi:hypothetical protein
VWIFPKFLFCLYKCSLFFKMSIHYKKSYTTTFYYLTMCWQYLLRPNTQIYSFLFNSCIIFHTMDLLYFIQPSWWTFRLYPDFQYYNHIAINPFIKMSSHMHTFIYVTQTPCSALNLLQFIFCPLSQLQSHCHTDVTIQTLPLTLTPLTLC